MSRVLVKIARDLNVGTAAIVEYLNLKGFDIENKPNARITDAMYDELLNRFQKSIEIKDAQRTVNIGAVRPKTEVQEPTSTKTSYEDSIEQKNEGETETHRVRLQTPVRLGKIDLSERLKQRIEKTKSPASTIETQNESKDESSELSQSIDENLTNNETPELRGLKILGKIDPDSFERPRRTKPNPPLPNKELEALNRMQNKQVASILKDCYYKKTTFIDLGNCSLALIPEELAILAWLKFINLGPRYKDINTNLWQNSKNVGSTNNFSNFFLFPKKLSNLTVLYLNDCSLKSIDHLSHLEQLEELSLKEPVAGFRNGNA